MNLKLTLLLSMITMSTMTTDIVLDPTKDTPSNRFLLAQKSAVLPVESMLEFILDLSELDPEDRCICIEICDCEEEDLSCSE